MIEATGRLGARVTFDGKSIVINREGRSFVGRGQQTIAISQLSAVEFMGSGVFNRSGFIRLIFAGADAPRARPGLRINDAFTDQWAVVFNRKHERAFKELRDAIQAAIAVQHQGNLRRSVDHVDVADQLRKFAELRDDGVLTEAEFESQKRKLL